MTHSNVRPRRSALYMPGANTRALEKAKTLAADCLILDLEDAVSPEAKPEARDNIVAAVKAGGYGRREVVVRINGLDTEWGMADLTAVVPAGPDAVLIPKVVTPDDIVRASRLISKHAGEKSIALWAMIERPLALLNVAQIAAARHTPGSLLAAFVLGTNDLAKETGASFSHERFAMIPHLTNCIAAATAYELAVLDGVYNDFKDADGLERECEQGRLLGMDGKTLIHPNQIEVCNAAFSPTHEDVDWSRKILAAFALPENADKGVITVEGRMVERLHAEMAARTVAIADAIAAADHG